MRYLAQAESRRYVSGRWKKVKKRQRTFAHINFNKLKPRWAPFFNQQDLGILKKLKENGNIIFFRPDTGKGTVIMNKTEYIHKMETILKDATNFRNMGDIDYKLIFRNEDRINRFLKTLKDNKTTDQTTYENLYIPMRPILSSYTIPSYKIVKLLTPLLENHFKNEYNQTNSLDFKNSILCQDSDLTMASFDVEALH